MLVSLRRSYAELITSGAQLTLLFIGIHVGSREGWLISLGLTAAISIVAWLSALKRLRAIRDTPTSRIASAAQGYVELMGNGRAYGETPFISKLSRLPCLWHRYRIDEKNDDNEWRTIDKGESTEPFLLDDGSGTCIVDPSGAEILTKHKDTWREAQFRYTEWKLISSDSLYVIGEFRTRSGAVEFDSRAELNALLAEWKQDKPALHARFDLNGDGELDVNEWMLARQAAKREVAKKKREAHAQPDIHLIGQPCNGKLFLISNLAPEKLSRRYLFWAWAHVVIFFGALGGLGWLLQTTDF
ncbi:MAG TPA: hypothetical protein VFQ99_02240 [Gallionella sp.]|nr:hypothetical protein [Gallionella sp.]